MHLRSENGSLDSTNGNFGFYHNHTPSEGFQLTAGAGGKVFPYAPRWGLSENEEREAVAAAKQRATTQLLNNGSAWAWLTATEKEVVDARATVSNTL